MNKLIIYVRDKAEQARQSKLFPRAEVLVIGSELMGKIDKRLERADEVRQRKRCKEQNQRKGGNSKKAFELGKRKFALLDEALGPNASLEQIASAMGKVITDIRPQSGQGQEGETDEND